MQTSIIQPAPRRRSLLPYTLAVFAGCAALAALAFCAGQGPDGSFDPMALKDKLDAMPCWSHSALAGALLVLIAIEFDFFGRLLAFPIAWLAFARTVTRRRLAAIRFVILSALLVWTGLNIVFGSWPAHHGWASPAFFCVLLVPIVLSGVEWRLSGEAPRHDLGKN